MCGSTNYNIDRWLRYVRLCRAKAEEYGVSLRDLDRALWMSDESGGVPLA